MEIEVQTIIADQGSIVVFSGDRLDGEGRVMFAVDHRPAQELINGMLNDEEVIAIVEPWQLMGPAL